MTIDIFSNVQPLNLTENAALIKDVIRDMVEFTKTLVVDSESAFKKATNLYSQAKTWKDTIEDKRKEMGEPFRKQVSYINDKAKELTEPLDKVISMTKVKTGEYQKLLEANKAKQDAELRAAASLFDAEDDIYIPDIEKTLRGDGARATTRIEKKFRILDIKQVPAKYLQLDEAAIKRDLKLGIDAIEGLEIYEEKTTQLVRR